MRAIEGLATNLAHPEASSRRLVGAAHEFEAQMMNELLKPLTSGLSEEQHDNQDSASDSVLTDYASEALGRGVSRQGGLGIANEILKSLVPREESGSIGKGDREVAAKGISLLLRFQLKVNSCSAGRHRIGLRQ